MSLGFSGYSDPLIKPTQNAMALGTLVVSFSGNSQVGSSGSPANVYGSSLAIGASNESEAITDFSSGEVIDTSADWGSSAPSDWPAEYVVPDVSAPGNAVNSSLAGGGYGTKSGTSMASPHVAGVVALMVAASAEQLTPGDIWEYLEQTAWKPDNWQELDDAPLEGDLQLDGTKNFVQTVDTTAGQKEVHYNAVESGTAHTEVTDTAEMDDGHGLVELPDHFGMVTSEEEPLTVQVTPHAEERVHPQIVETSTEWISVEDFGDGPQDYRFSYTVKGVREGFEDEDVVREPSGPGSR